MVDKLGLPVEDNLHCVHAARVTSYRGAMKVLPSMTQTLKWESIKGELLTRHWSSDTVSVFSNATTHLSKMAALAHGVSLRSGLYWKG